jgi:hypothetical protein
MICGYPQAAAGFYFIFLGRGYWLPMPVDVSLYQSITVSNYLSVIDHAILDCQSLSVQHQSPSFFFQVVKIQRCP